MFRIVQEVTPASASHILKNLQTRTGPQTLQIASNRKFSGALFREAAALETVIQFIKSSRLDTLRTFFAMGSDLDARLTEFTSQPSNLAALMYSGRVEDVNGAEIPTSAVTACLLRRESEANDISQLMGRTGVPGIDLVSPYGSNEATFPHSVYFRPAQGEISLERLQAITSAAMLPNKGKISARLSLLYERLKLPVSLLLKEVYENTDKHALTSHDGGEISSGVRGLFIRLITVPKTTATAERVFPEAPPYLHLTLDAWNRHFSGRTLHFIEVTVFDSGPGYASRITRSSLGALTEERERASTISCFRARVTSTDTRGRGMGLPEVLRIVAANSGVLRIRTGRTCLYASHHDRVTNSDLTSRLAFWPHRPSILPILDGTIISVLIPAFSGE